MFAKNILFLDLGGSSLKGIVINEKKFSIIAKNTQENSGIANGYIVNAELFQIALSKLIKDLEKKTKNKIMYTVLLLGGSLIKYKVLKSNAIKIQGIVDNNIIKLIDQKIKKWISENDALLIKHHNIEYKLDEVSVENPVGLYSTNLEFVQLIAYSNINQLGSIVYLLEKNNLDIIDIMPSIYAAAQLHLHEDEKILGSLVFDVGAHKIDWAYYFNDKPINAGSIPIGSDLITIKIAKSLKVSLNEAKKIKHDHCHAQLLPEHFCAWVEFSKEGSTDFILESEVIRKILPEIEQISSQIQKIIQYFGNKAYLSVLCGYGGWLDGFSKYLQKNLSSSVKLSPSSNPEYDALNGAIIKFQADSFKKKKNILQKTLYWLKENL